MKMNNTRRKRNIELRDYNRNNQTLSVFPDNHQVEPDEYEIEDDGYNYEEMTVDSEEDETEELEEEYQEEIIIEEQLEEEPKQLYIDGKPFIPKQKKSKPTFEESYDRITTYLSKDVTIIVRMLLKQGQIQSITALINDSVKPYLLNEFSDENNN